jgi:alpha-galactosidase
MNRSMMGILLLGAISFGAFADEPVYLESLDLKAMTCGWGDAMALKSVQGYPLTIDKKVYEHGVGTHADSELLVDLGGEATRFTAMVGVDDETAKRGSVSFEVWVDDKKAVDTAIVKGGEPARKVDVDLTGAKQLLLIVSSLSDTSFDHADWADAIIHLKPGATVKPKAGKVANEPPIPIAMGTKPEPSINFPRITGATPGRPFLFRVPATGDAPVTFVAEGLPPGLALDAATGIISGALESAGTWPVKITAKNALGADTETLTIVGGDNKLALTPPMGWNSWYTYFVTVTDEQVRQAADWMVKSGLAGHGYQYINIDDAWEADRDQEDNIMTNRRFPDMKALGDYVHSRGLKFGIYTSPGPKTCGGYTGSYEHEQQDIDMYALWGVDFVKHDWCSYSQIAKDDSLESLKKPYLLMKQCIDKSGRDMVYSLCQYGMGNVWEWGAEVGGNLWRTTGDMGQTWTAMSAIGFGQNGKESYAGPGRWNDPDMLVVGTVGWGNNLSQTPLTPNEQITYVTLWSMLASPLIVSCDLSKLDPFTLALLTNDEVIEVNQDPLGKQAYRRAADGMKEVWAKSMSDGSLAVGLFNRGRSGANVTAKWSDLGLTGAQSVRDLWQQKDLGVAEGQFTAAVPAHGALLVRMKKK